MTALASGEILLGLGNDIDYELVWDQAALQRQVGQAGLTSADVRQAEIVDQRTLLGSVCHFMATGQGGERPVAPGVIDAFLDGFSWRATLGGTAARAAVAMDRLGTGGTIHLTTMNDAVRCLLPDGFHQVCSARADHVFPHLVVQYPAGGAVELADGCRIEAGVANRLIYVHDDANAAMVIAPQFPGLAAQARLLLLSGLNGIVSEEVLARRLADLDRALSGVSPQAVVVLEEAGYHRPAMGEMVRAALGPRMAVHSMNSEEFMDLAGAGELPPDPARLAEQARVLHGRLGAANLVVHSPGWALADGPAAHALRVGLEMGMRAATARYAFGDDWQVSDLARFDTYRVNQDGQHLADWTATCGDAGLAVVPGRVVEVSSPTTIGLGDTFVGGFLAGLAQNWG